MIPVQDLSTVLNHFKEMWATADGKATLFPDKENCDPETSINCPSGLKQSKCQGRDHTRGWPGNLVFGLSKELI